MVDNVMVLNVTTEQRKILKQFIADGLLEARGGGDFIDNIARYPHFYFKNGFVVGFIHACLFDPEMNFIRLPEITFPELVYKINSENPTSNKIN